MKSKILKLLAAVGVFALSTMASVASAGSYDYEYNSEEPYEKVGLQCHTYHAPEGPFIW